MESFHYVYILQSRSESLRQSVGEAPLLMVRPSLGGRRLPRRSSQSGGGPTLVAS